MKYLIKTCFFALTITAYLLCASLLAAPNQGPSLFRYKNHEGVQVINSTMPAEYAQMGYDIITYSGELIKHVPPAPTKDAIKQAEKERAVLENFSELKKRYSSIDDIQSAKARKLDNIKTSITILEGTIRNIQSNIDDQVSKAAGFERRGAAIPAAILKQINDTKIELKVSKDLLQYRNQEYSDVSKKYDQDISDFIVGDTLQKQKARAAAGL